MSVDTTRAPYRKKWNVVCNSSTETTSYMIVCISVVLEVSA